MQMRVLVQPPGCIAKKGSSMTRWSWLPLRTKLLALAIVLVLLPTLPAHAQPTNTRTLIPIGASYQAATRDMFVRRAIAHNSDGVVRLAVVMAPFSTSSLTITLQERQTNLADAQVRANQIQASCAAAVTAPITCTTVLPDIQLRSDASDSAKVAAFSDQIDGVYILGGDQVIAMEIIANTPFETALEQLYQAGAPFAGNSAGSAVQSRRMIAGYLGDNFAWNGLERGAVDLAYGPTEAITRGLRFGLPNAVIDQHVFERGRLARLLQATQQLPGSKLGLGTDFGTGTVVENERIITGTAGLYGGVVVDQETYGAASGAQYLGPRQTLTISNVVLHLLAPGPYGYDLQTRQPIISGTVDATPPDIANRTYDFLQAPRGAGALLLGGDLAESPTGTVVARFAALAKNTGKPTLVLATGFVTPTDALSATTFWTANLAALGLTQVQTATLLVSDTNALTPTLDAAGAIFVVGDDQPTIVGQLEQLRALNLAGRWRAGAVLLLDNAAAALAGATVSAEPTPIDLETTEIAASDSFLAGEIDLRPGLDLVPGAAFEPRALYDYRYGRLVSHTYRSRSVVAFGIERGTALEIDGRGARVLGDSAVFALDARYARVFEPGTNGAFAATWLLANTYAPGTSIARTRFSTVLTLIARQGSSPAAR
jgi:cyanophycinase